MMTEDQAVSYQRELQERTANAVGVRRENVQLFTRMWLTLGPDVVNVAQHNFTDVLEESKNLAARRWDVLRNQEGQILQEEQTLASRPRQRPSQPSDDTVPDRTLEKWNAAWEAETKGLRESLAALKEITKNERRELESWRVDFRRK